MSRLAALYARVSPKLAHRPGSTAATRLHARIHRLTRGRIGSRVLGADVLTLRTTGRRSGQPRDAPILTRRQRAQTHLLTRRPSPWTPCTHTTPQGHTVRMIAPGQPLPGGLVLMARRPLRPLVPVDLPVDVIIVLEQQKRADQPQRPNKTPRQRWCVVQ